MYNKMDEDDKKLWEMMVSDVKKLNKEASLSTEECRNPRKPPKTPKRSDQSHNRANNAPALSENIKQPDEKSSFQIDRATSEKLRKGKIRIDARLDLHGMNKVQAHDALISFINNAYARGHRCVLVITGKGKAKSSDQHWIHNEPGVLKKSVPTWLKTPPLNNIVLKTQQAAIKHGADGALYVLLRKKR